MPATQEKTAWPISARLTVLALLLLVAALAVRGIHPVRRLKQVRRMVFVKRGTRGAGAVASLLSGAAPAQALPAVFEQEEHLPRVLMTEAYPLNQPISNLPIDTRLLKTGKPYTPKLLAETFYQTFGTNHMQFNTTMPVTVVDSRKTPGLILPIKIMTNWGSDDASHVPAAGCRIEGADNPAGDLHCIVYDTATGLLHETFGTKVVGGQYTALAYRRWNTNKNQQGKPGQNSADAAGLPILPLLLRYSEASTGPVNHALRFTMNLTRANANGGAFTLPASHAAGQNWGSTAYMGMRLRLRPNFDASGFSPMNRTIITTLKNYGLVLADNGISGLVVADDDPRWDQDDLGKLGGSMILNDFIPVDSGPIIDSSGSPVE